MRAPRRRRADPSVGSEALVPPAPQPRDCISSSARGSEGVMTRAQRRRRALAESTEPAEPSSEEALFQDPSGGPVDRRGWADLDRDLVEEISDRLLSLDVAEFLRFRAVCKPWRDGTVDRGCTLEPRFRPRGWAVVTVTPDAGSRRRLLNLATGASLGVDLPALATHCHVCAADGLLVLFHRTTKAVRLLDPLRNAVVEFPPISSIVAAAAPPTRHGHFSAVFRNGGGGVDGESVNGAGFDDSTSSPALVLCLRDNVSNIVFARPGDARWTLVDQGDAFHSVYHPLGMVLFHSLLSLGRRCYVASPEGSVYLVRLCRRPLLPKLVQAVDQRRWATRDVMAYKMMRVLSFLFSDGGDGTRRMMMVRYWRNVDHFGGREALDLQTPEQLCTVGSVTGRFEVLEVDLVGRRLVPVRSLGRRAVFVGMTHCVLVSADTFPSIAADAIYLGLYNQPHNNFSVYHLGSGKTEPPHEFFQDEDWRVVPRARPCNLDQYLVCYVDRMHRFNPSCINHAGHYLGKIPCYVLSYPV